MIWAAFGSRGKSEIALIDCTMDSETYQEVLKDHLLPYATHIGGRKWQFQQDNASIHMSHSTRNWFKAKKIRVMKWPSKSPDLNPIENLWGILARRVYHNGRQFATVDELKSAITKEWHNLTLKDLQTLVNSMPKRVFAVIQKNGAATKY